MKSDSAISLHLEHDSAQRYDIFVHSAALVSKLLVLEGAREVAEQFNGKLPRSAYSSLKEVA